MCCWLLKSEGDCYPIAQLKRDRRTAWTGIRNYQARNFMMNDMKVGDLCLFYHSNASPSGVYGIAKVVSKGHPDETQFDRGDEHFDPKATREKPIWHCVDVAYVATLARPVSLEELKKDRKLEGMLVRNPGTRLSIQPVEEKHFRYITEVLGAKA